MAMILTTKYTASRPNRYWLFISNRFLRIYPCYYVILFLSLAFYAAASFHLHHPPTGWCFGKPPGRTARPGEYFSSACAS